MLNDRCRPIAVSAAVALAATFAAAPGFADVPITMTQQGKLVEDDGTPMTGPQTLEFAIYDAPEEGTVLFSQVVETQLDDNGFYSVVLGDEDQPLDADLLAGEQDLYLALTVDTEEMSPRMELTAVPFASVAQRAHSAEHAEVAQSAESVADGAVDADGLAQGAVTPGAVDSIDWDQIEDVPSEVAEPTDTLAELSCSADELALYDGGDWTCSPLVEYSGQDFALSDQTCPDDEVAAGISTDGELICSPQPDYSGQDFALSDQSCAGNEVVTRITDDGYISCTPQQDTTYSAGTGLQLEDEQFSVDTGYLDSNYYAQGEDIELSWGDVIDLRWSSNELLFRDLSFVAPLSDQLQLEGGDFVVADGDLSVDEGDFAVEEGKQTIGFEGDDTAPRSALDIKQYWTREGVTMERDDRGWQIGTAAWSGNLYFQHADPADGSYFGRAYVDPDDGEWTTVSDERLKRDIEPIDDVLDSVVELQPTTYRLENAGEDARRSPGFIAQQVAELFPELVRHDVESGYYAIAYADFAAISVQAIREQQQIIDQQQDQIDELEGRLDALDERIERLE